MLPKILTAALAASAPKVGDLAPEFTVQDTDGKTHQLSKMLEKGPVILAFFPRAFTPGCTKEMKSYTARFEELTGRNAQLLAVSTDDGDKQKKFKESLNAPYPFIADSDGKLSELFGVRIPVVGIANRFTFVIGPGRKVLEVQSGSDAVDISSAVQACPMQKTPPPAGPDAGAAAH